VTTSTRTDRTAPVVDLRPPAWDWTFEMDGALALEEGVDSWVNLPVPPDPLHRSARRTGASPRTESALSSSPLPPQPRPHPSSRRRRRAALAARKRRRDARVQRLPVGRARPGSRHTGRIVGIVVVSFALVVTLFLTAFGSSGTDGSPVSFAPSKRLNPAPPPRPQVLATHGLLKLQLPIPETRVTAIGYHAAASGALALDPVGSRANEGLGRRIVRRLFGGGGSGIRYYQLGGEGGPSTAVMNVGAPSGTDVYSPVDGTVVGLAPNVVSGRKYGVRIDVQPTEAPSLVVSMTHLRADPALDVGDALAASRTKIGSVIDFSKIEQQALARYTQDAGNHVAVEVQPAATLAIP
jgi:murein DD-endopeptidase MepM/ murein hydrolase activator NlpD